MTTAPTVTPDQMDLIKRTVAKGATDQELKLYLYDCERRNIHPLDKLLHFTKRKQRDGTYKYTPITSIDFMRSQAAASGEYAGNDDPEFTPEALDENVRPRKATVTVYRMVKGTRCPFSATARWAEYYPGDKSGTMWKKMPHTMLGKCAEALALRKGFPQQLAGLYAREEMDQAGNGNGNGTGAPTVEGVNKQGGEALPPPPAGTVRLAVVLPRTTAQNKPYWAVTDSNGEFFFIFAMSKDENDEWVDGADLAKVAIAAAESGEPVVLRTLATDQGKAFIVGITLYADNSENTVAGRERDIDEALGDKSSVVDLTEDDIPF